MTQLEKYQPVGLPRPSVPQTGQDLVQGTQSQIQKIATQSAERILALQVPAAAALESLRAIHRHSEAVIGMAHEDALLVKRHLESLDAPPEALDNLRIRTYNFETYVSRLEEAHSEAVIEVYREGATAIKTVKLDPPKKRSMLARMLT